MLLFELTVARLPHIRAHIGPPVWNRINAEKFRSKHITTSLPGPYIVQGRYETEISREYTEAKDLLSSQSLLQLSLGRHVRQSLENNWQVSEGKGCWTPEFTSFIARIFQTVFPARQDPTEKIACFFLYADCRIERDGSSGFFLPG